MYKHSGSYWLLKMIVIHNAVLSLLQIHRQVENFAFTVEIKMTKTHSWQRCIVFERLFYEIVGH